MDVGKYEILPNCEFPANQRLCTSSWELSEITETPEAKALTASKNHKEAEKRRRERINSHLHTLRTLLPCNSKVDKATLLGNVVQRVKELKDLSSEAIKLETFPSETDEITVISSGDRSSDGRSLIRASWCCEDRSGLIPELIQMLRSLRLNPLRAEMVTLGGRIRNILIVAGDKENSEELVRILKDALKSLVHRMGSDFGGRTKRRRVLR